MNLRSQPRYIHVKTIGRVLPTFLKEHLFKQHNRKIRAFATLALALCLTLVFNLTVYSQSPDSDNLPPAKIHVLPQSLTMWHKNNRGDYFKQIESTPLGYLVWSSFPLQIYVESIDRENTAANRRFQQWTAAAQKAIAEWNIYLPLQEIVDRNKADIVILRSQPARETKLNPDTGLFDIPRAVAARTNYKFYLTEEPMAIAMRMTIEVSPNFSGTSLLATMRHELGHALGLWGHSPNKRDALYYSQVSNPQAISQRDINTLKKIYQQPTKLGWRIR